MLATLEIMGMERVSVVKVLRSGIYSGRKNDRNFFKLKEISAIYDKPNIVNFILNLDKYWYSFDEREIPFIIQNKELTKDEYHEEIAEILIKRKKEIKERETGITNEENENNNYSQFIVKVEDNPSIEA